MTKKRRVQCPLQTGTIGAGEVVKAVEAGRAARALEGCNCLRRDDPTFANHQES
jgi:hypothetical protein